jgi:hypothetical protein
MGQITTDQSNCGTNVCGFHPVRHTSTGLPTFTFVILPNGTALPVALALRTNLPDAAKTTGDDEI